jgi:hypothetical protein
MWIKKNVMSTTDDRKAALLFVWLEQEKRILLVNDRRYGDG